MDTISARPVTAADEAARLSGLLVKANKPQAAAVLAMRGLAIFPDSAALWTNLGAAFIGKRDYDHARMALGKALEISPGHTVALGNLSLVYNGTGQRERAMDLLATVIATEGSAPALRWNRALMRLQRGDYAGGLEDYDARIDNAPEFYPAMAVPMWRGEDLTGKTIHVETEQGVGDNIMMSRFLPWLGERAGRVTFRAMKLAEPLYYRFGDTLEFGRSCSTEAAGIADYYVYLGSLMRLYGLRPGFVPPDPGLIREAVERDGPEIEMPPPHSAPALRVGISWTGNPQGDRNTEKSVPFPLMMTLAQDPRVWLYSLQVGHGSGDIELYGAGNFVHDLAPTLINEGFLGTGRAILGCDLVVTCCTSVAHLAGAMGVPCWVMLDTDPYWPWGQNGERSEWYPSVRLFRQQNRGEWGPVIARVMEELRCLLNNR